MTAVWLTATYTTAALLLAVRIGRRLRNQGDTMEPIYRDLRRKQLNAAVYERLAFAGDEDFHEWVRECFSPGDGSATFAITAAWMQMAALPAPEFDGEGHL